MHPAGAEEENDFDKSFSEFDAPTRGGAKEALSRASLDSPRPEAFHLWTPPPYCSQRVENTTAT